MATKMFVVESAVGDDYLEVYVDGNYVGNLHGEAEFDHYMRVNHDESVEVVG